MADDQGGYYDEQGNWIDTSGGYYDEQGNWIDTTGGGGGGEYAEWDNGAGEGDWPVWSEVWDPESEGPVLNCYSQNHFVWQPGARSPRSRHKKAATQ